MSSPIKTLGLDLDIKQIEQEVEALTTSLIKDRLKNMVNRTVADMFYDPTNPYRTGHSSQLAAEQNKDLGFMRKVVEGALTEVALDPKWHAYAKKVYDNSFEGFVKEAAERKARHDANKMVFADRGERCKAEKQG